MTVYDVLAALQPLRSDERFREYAARYYFQMHGNTEDAIAGALEFLADEVFNEAKPEGECATKLQSRARRMINKELRQ